MSTKVHAVFALNRGFERIDVDSNCPIFAREFLKSINHTRHEFSHVPVGYSQQLENSLIIIANKTGAIAFNFNLALSLAVGSKSLTKVAHKFDKILAVSYNDQCPFYALSYYEDGILRRRICEADGDTVDEITSEGELLQVEIDYLRSSPPPDEDACVVSEFEVDGQIYKVEGLTPMFSAGLALTERLIGLDILNLYSKSCSIFKAKPWWKRW